MMLMFMFIYSGTYRWVMGPLVLLLLSGCLGLHETRNPLPPPHAPLQQRVEAYRDLRALMIRRTFYETRYTVRELNQLRLGNGSVVFNPMELITIVGPNNPTAESARLYAQFKQKEQMMFWISAVVGTTGAVVALIAPSTANPNLPPEAKIAENPLFWTGLIVASLASLSMGLSYPIFGITAAEYQRKAFLTYNQDLRKRLGLQVIPRHLQDGQGPPPDGSAPAPTPAPSNPPATPNAPPSQDNGPQPPEPPPAQPSPAPQRIQR